LLLKTLVLAFGWGEIHAEPAASKEYQIKAAFLLNFAQFVEWPSNSFPNTNDPITIGVLGDDPFGASMDETIRGEAVRGHKVVVLRSRRLQDLKSCQLLFISKSEKARVSEIISELNADPVLTVSDFESFARRGGIINFFLEGTKVRFEINPSAARHQGLKLSSQLLSLGKLVNPEPAK
jgi:hypothetical protein